jgi:hypothetical protein
MLDLRQRRRDQRLEQREREAAERQNREGDARALSLWVVWHGGGMAIPDEARLG